MHNRSVSGGLEKFVEQSSIGPHFSSSIYVHWLLLAEQSFIEGVSKCKIVRATVTEHP